MRLNKRGNEKFIWFLAVLFVILSPINGSQEKGDIPAEVNIDFDKNEVLPGEEMVITLSGFKDMFKHPANKGFWVNVEVRYGEILNGFDIKGSELDVVKPDGKSLPKRKTFRITGQLPVI